MVRGILALFLSLNLYAIEGVLIPFYHYPRPNDPQVARLIALKKRFPQIPFIVVINPNNGHFTRPDPNFTRMIRQLAAADIQLVGYVYTHYGKRDLQEVLEDINHWERFYKEAGIEGIFLDEVACSKEEYYQPLARKIKERFSLLIANPGVPCHLPWSHITITHEERHYQASRHTLDQREAILVHSSPPVPFQALAPFDYAYVTDARLPNPWERLSRYLPQLLAFIQRTRLQKDLNENGVQLQMRNHK
ncbi:MAG: hypothetical protein C6I00_00745 [Nitratiruptor sp.]|nr:hypothetical protein [Nitratiruptor sp.]NPA83403.1 hypothetical protein [Campylobacterota bacterium]